MNNHQSSASPEFDSIPEQNETITTQVIDDDFSDKRRVKRTYHRVIADGEHITYIHSGDVLVRAMNGEHVEHYIDDIGPDISSSDGMHISLVGGDGPIHLNLIRQWIENGTALIHGRRESIYSELEGVDY